MKSNSIIAAFVALSVGAGSALAQVPKTVDPADARFIAADVDKTGALEGKELDSFKADLAKIDTDKDGKISRQEFHVAVMTGVVK